MPCNLPLLEHLCNFMQPADHPRPGPPLSIEIHTLGTPGILIEDSEDTTLPAQPLRFALLVFLVAERGATRDRLLATFWPGRRRDRARRSLNQTIYQLRTALGPVAVVTRGEIVAAGEHVRLDIDGLPGLLAAGAPAGLARYRGPFLAGLPAPTAPFARWAQARRTELARLHAAARGEQVAELLRTGDQAGAIAAARAWAAAEPPGGEGARILEGLISEAAPPHLQGPALPARAVPGPRPRRRRTAIAATLLLGAAVFALALRTGPHDDVVAAVVVIPFRGEHVPADSTAPHRALLRSAAALPGVRAVEAADLAAAPAGWSRERMEPVLRAAEQRGFRYVVTGEVSPPGSGPPLVVEAWHVPSATRILLEAADGREPEADALARFRFALARTIADREAIRIDPPGRPLAATRSPTAAGHFLDGRDLLSRGLLLPARVAFQHAARVDPAFGPAHVGAALAAGMADDARAAHHIAAGAIRTPRIRGDAALPLLRAVHLAARGDAVAAVALMDSVATAYPDDPQARAALALALGRFGRRLGLPADSTLAALLSLQAEDSAYVPFDHQFTEAALAARRFDLARQFADRSLTEPRGMRSAVVEIVTAGPSRRAAALERLRWHDADSLALAFLLLARAGDLQAADSLGALLQQSIRTPGDQALGAALRLAALTALGRPGPAARAWSRTTAPASAEYLLVAELAGSPIATAGQASGAAGPDGGDPQEDVRLLAHDASIRGDSAAVRRLELPGSADPSAPPDPQVVALRLALSARLHLLAGDTARAARTLRRAVRTLSWTPDAGRPLDCLGPQRLLAADLLLASGHDTAAARIAASFEPPACLADLLLLPHARRLRAWGAGPYP